MLLLRHNALQPPFHDYARLSVEALDQLASGDASPDIAPLPDSMPWDEKTLDTLKSASFFVCSGLERTQQTCAALMQRFCLEKKVVVDTDLDEIFFVPSKLIESPHENPLQAVRQKLYTRLASGGDGVENPDMLERRINAIHRKYGHAKCVLFSHGFLIKLIESYHQHDQNMRKALAALDQADPIDYLSSREIL